LVYVVQESVKLKNKNLHDFWPHVPIISNYLLILTNASITTGLFFDEYQMGFGVFLGYSGF
jgi:hypothetical protein